MTKLLIDIGNTRLKLATLNGDKLGIVGAIETISPEDCQRQLCETIQSHGLEAQACIAVSVASQAMNSAIETAVKPAPLQWIVAERELAGVSNGYPDPTQLGPDRWVAMIGLTRHFLKPHPPLVLANFGTATTIDTLSPENEFKGGLILPGVTMMHESLAKGTARLPNTPGAIVEFPTNTASAISSGVARAQVGALVQQVALVKAHFRQDPIVCISGGARSVIAPELKRTLLGLDIKTLPDVVLDGLFMLAQAAD